MVSHQLQLTGFKVNHNDEDLNTFLEEALKDSITGGL
jgi:hypothetical protein